MLVPFLRDFVFALRTLLDIFVTLSSTFCILLRLFNSNMLWSSLSESFLMTGKHPTYHACMFPGPDPFWKFFYIFYLNGQLTHILTRTHIRWYGANEHVRWLTRQEHIEAFSIIYFSFQYKKSIFPGIFETFLLSTISSLCMLRSQFNFA